MGTTEKEQYVQKLEPTCIRGILGPIALGAWRPRGGWLEMWVSGLQRALLGPLLKAAWWQREENKALAPELPSLPTIFASCQAVVRVPRSCVPSTSHGSCYLHRLEVPTSNAAYEMG